MLRFLRHLSKRSDEPRWIRLGWSIPESMAVGASESGNEEARLRFKLRSPYFIPDAVRGSSPKPGWVAVAFRYIDGEEPGRVEKVNEKVFATKGRHSGRLLALEV